MGRGGERNKQRVREEKKKGRVKIVAISKNCITRRKKEINSHHSGSGGWVSLTPKHTLNLLQDFSCAH